MKVAILDLGTNTFHVLIAEISSGRKLSVLHRDERWVFLAEKGIDHIAATAIERARNVVTDYNKIIHHHQCEVISAFGTAAFRKAGNKKELADEIQNILDCEVTILPGEREAELIHKGVYLAFADAEERRMVMDIGGGSTEFIIAKGDNILWKKSFPLGVSVLKQKFHHHEPILAGEIENMKNFVGNELEDLHEAYNRHKPTLFIGASGAFDSFASMLLLDRILPGDTCHTLDRQQLLNLFKKLYILNWEERKQVNGLISFRTEMIVAASVLTEYVLTNFSFEHVMQSAYALKEGVLSEMMQ